jgi:hypothetical protein
MELVIEDLFLSVIGITQLLQHDRDQSPNGAMPQNAFTGGFTLEIRSVYSHKWGDEGKEVWDKLDRGKPRLVWMCLRTSAKIVWEIEGFPEAEQVSSERMASIINYNLLQHWRKYLEGQLRYAGHEERRLKNIIGLE